MNADGLTLDSGRFSRAASRGSGLTIRDTGAWHPRPYRSVARRPLHRDSSTELVPVNRGRSALADFAGAKSAVALRRFAEFRPKPPGEVTGVGKSAFKGDFGDAAGGIEEAPAGVLKSHVAPKFKGRHLCVPLECPFELENS